MTPEELRAIKERSADFDSTIAPLRSPAAYDRRALLAEVEALRKERDELVAMLNCATDHGRALMYPKNCDPDTQVIVITGKGFDKLHNDSLRILSGSRAQIEALRKALQRIADYEVPDAQATIAIARGVLADQEKTT